MDAIIIKKEEIFRSIKLEMENEITSYMKILSKLMDKYEEELRKIHGSYRLYNSQKYNQFSNQIEENIKYMISVREKYIKKLKNIVIIEQLKLMKYYQGITKEAGARDSEIKEMITVIINEINRYKDEKMREILKNFYVYVVRITELFYAKFKN